MNISRLPENLPDLYKNELRGVINHSEDELYDNLTKQKDNELINQFIKSFKKDPSWVEEHQSLTAKILDYYTYHHSENIPENIEKTIEEVRKLFSKFTLNENDEITTTNYIHTLIDNDQLSDDEALNLAESFSKHNSDLFGKSLMVKDDELYPYKKAIVNKKNKLGHFLLAQSSENDQIRKDLSCLFKIKGEKKLTSVFHLAIRSGDRQLVQLMIQAGVDINLQDELGMSPLLLASALDHIQIVQDLLNANADVNLTSEACDNLTPLFVAFFAKRLDIMDLLIKAKADPNIAINHVCSPLFKAAGDGNLKMVKYLLSGGGANVDSLFMGASPIYVAAENGHTEIVKELIKKKCDINFMKGEFGTPLFIAAQRGHLKTVQELVKANANLHKKYNGQSAIEIAQKNNYSEIAIYLENVMKDDEEAHACLSSIINCDDLSPNEIFQEIQVFIKKNPDSFVKALNIKKNGKYLYMEAFDNSNPRLTSFLLQQAIHADVIQNDFLYFSGLKQSKLVDKMVAILSKLSPEEDYEDLKEGVCQGISILWAYYQFLDKESEFCDSLCSFLNISPSLIQNADTVTLKEMLVSEPLLRIINDILFLFARFVDVDQHEFLSFLKFASDQSIIKNLKNHLKFNASFKFDKNNFSSYPTLVKTLSDILFSNKDKTKWLYLSTGAHVLQIFYKNNCCTLFDPNETILPLPFENSPEGIKDFVEALAIFLKTNKKKFSLHFEVISPDSSLDELEKKQK